MSFSFKGEVDLFTDCMVLQIWVDISDLLVENKPGWGALEPFPYQTMKTIPAFRYPTFPPTSPNGTHLCSRKASTQTVRFRMQRTLLCDRRTRVIIVIGRGCRQNKG